MLKSGLLEALAIREARARVTPEAAAIVKSVDDTGAGDDASAESGVGFSTRTGAEREARERLPAGIEKACLIVAARVEAGDEAGIGVLNFVFVAGGDGTGAERESGLLLKTGAIKLVDKSEEWRIGVGVQCAVFMAAETMNPMRAGAEIPSQMEEEKLNAFELREAGREEENGSGKTGEAGVASGGKAQMIGVAETVAEVAGKTAIEKSVVASLAIGLKIGASEGVIERAEKAGNQSTAARGRITAALGEEIQLGNARGAAMAEELNDAGDGIGAVESAFSAVNDFELVNIVEGLIGEIEEAAGLVERRD